MYRRLDPCPARDAWAKAGKRITRIRMRLTRTPASPKLDVERGRNRDGRDGGGLGAEDARTEGHGLPVVDGEEVHLIGRPSAFRADGQGKIKERHFGERGGDAGGLRGFGEQDPRGAGFVLESGLEWRWVFDGGDGRAAGLLRGLEGDATPSFGALWGGLGKVLFCPAGVDGGDAGYAQFRGLFDGPLHVVELEDGEQEMQGKCDVRLELFVEGEDHFVLGDGDDFGAVEEASRDDVEDLARSGTEDAREMSRLIAGEGSGFRGPGVGDPTTAGHYSLFWSASDCDEEAVPFPTGMVMERGPWW